MKYLLSLAALTSLAVAQPIHHVHKREAEPAEVVVTQHFTDYVTVQGGAPAATQPAAAPAPQATTLAVAAAAPAPASSQDTQESQAPSPAPASSQAPASSEAPSSSASAPAPSSSSTSSGGGQYALGGTGVSYSPYSSSGGCKSASDVSSDLSKLSDYAVIRLYGVDCSQVQNVAAALGKNQKLFLGLYDMGNIQSDVQSMNSQLQSNGGWDVVHTVSVGNELVNSGQANPGQVGQYVSTARSALKSAGYNGPVVAVDTFIAIINNPDLCQYSDYIAANAHAFFDADTQASDAGPWANQQIERVYGACNGQKQVVISESGWPSQGSSNGAAVPSSQNQQAAISSLRNTIGNDVVLFTAFNDLWKSPGYLNCEQYWGFIN